MSSQLFLLHHSVIQKGTWLFFPLPSEKKRAATCDWLSVHPPLLRHCSAWCFQRVDDLPKCNNADLAQFPREIRTSGSQMSALSKKSLLSERSKRALFYSPIFSLACETCWRGTWFYFQATIHASLLIQLPGSVSSVQRAFLTVMLSACSCILSQRCCKSSLNSPFEFSNSPAAIWIISKRWLRFVSSVSPRSYFPIAFTLSFSF